MPITEPVNVPANASERSVSTTSSPGTVARPAASQSNVVATSGLAALAPLVRFTQRTTPVESPVAFPAIGRSHASPAAGSAARMMP